MRAALAVAVFGVAVAAVGAWDQVFKWTSCYKNGLGDLDDRMPQSLGNLIALLEKYERQSKFINPEEIAEAIVKRYKTDGIVFNPEAVAQWGKHEDDESNKHDLVDKVLNLEKKVPDNTYDPREECSLHFLTSHSTDIYPHAGMDDVWETRRRRRNSRASYMVLPDGVDPARHPIENGVMYTPYGPVSVGTLLEGIAAASNQGSKAITEIYPNDVDYMPAEMKTKRLYPKHVTTLAGDIGQAAMVAASKTDASVYSYLGPEGRFANLTAAPKLFTQATVPDDVVSLLTRAEVFAGIDAMLIQKVLGSSSSTMRLSQVLRMYYGEHGLPGNRDYRSCNRMEAFKTLSRDEVKEQALYFMYAFSHKFPSAHDLIEQNAEDFPMIENYFTTALNNGMNRFNSFVDSYDYQDFDRCPVYQSREVLCEGLVDLLVVYGREGGTLAMEQQREYITHLAQLVGVSELGSRLGVLDGKKATWIEPMTNFTNVADWGSNFTTDQAYVSGSGSEMQLVLDQLRAYYSGFYAGLRGDGSNARANAQVVLWNVPSSPTGDQDQFKKDMDLFRLNYPDVYFLMVGKSKGSYNDILLDIQNDFFVNNFVNVIGEKEKFAETIAKRVCQVPTVFIYPACDTNNHNYTNYNEGSHVYEGYVSPNFTSYVRIAPHNFHFSGHLKLTVSGGDVKVCSSRLDMSVQDTAADYECVEGQGELEYWNLCGRWLSECKPIYLSVTGNNVLSSRCTDDECQYPNQVKWEMRHEGMKCGGASATVSLALLCLALLTRFLQ